MPGGEEGMWSVQPVRVLLEPRSVLLSLSQRTMRFYPVFPRRRPSFVAGFSATSAREREAAQLSCRASTSAGLRAPSAALEMRRHALRNEANIQRTRRDSCPSRRTSLTASRFCAGGQILIVSTEDNECDWLRFDKTAYWLE